MAGHSQFANIMHRKGVQDKKRGKIFQKLVREIYVAVKANGAITETNPRLRLIIEKAKAVNMSKDIILRAINKASNQNDTTKYEEIIYEGYGPCSVAIIVHCLTDNKNRTASNIRSYFNKCEGKLGTTNSVQYLFNAIGVIEFASALSLETIIEMVIEFNILNWEKNNDFIRLEVMASELSIISKTLESNGINNFVTNDIQNLPVTLVCIDNNKELQLAQKLFELLEDDDDVLHIEHNLSIE